MRRGCDVPSSSYVASCEDAQACEEEAREEHNAPVPAPIGARRTTAAHTPHSPIRLSTISSTDALMDVSHPRVSRKNSPAHRPSTSAGSTQRQGKHIRSSTVSHKTMEQVSCQQLPLFASWDAEVAVKSEVTSEIVAETATQRIVAIEDEIAALRGYLSSRLDEKGLPRDDTALLDSCGVDTGRLLRMARRLAALEDEMRRLG